MKPHFTVFGLIVAMAVPLLAAPRPTMAAEVTVRMRAVGDQDPFVFSWLDGSDGKVSFDPTVEDQIHDLVAGVHYLFTDQNQVILALPKGNELEQVFPAIHERHNEAGTFFVVHLRSQDRTLFLDGTIYHFQDNPTQGYAQWNVLMLNSQGGSISSLIQQDLTFPANNTTPGRG